MIIFSGKGALTERITNLSEYEKRGRPDFVIYNEITDEHHLVYTEDHPNLKDALVELVDEWLTQYALEEAEIEAKKAERAKRRTRPSTV